MGFAKQERSALCDALTHAGPDAPTLCEGWSGHDLAAHVWCRENDPLAAPGVLIPALEEVTVARMESVKRRWTFPGLVEQIRRGPRPISVFSIPGVDELANLSEFFVHTEDVRRPAGLPPRDTTAAFEAQVGRMLERVAKPLFRNAGIGIVLERTDTDERLRVRPGDRTVTIIGRPSELLLFAHGRTRHADVQLVGDPDAVTALKAGQKGF